MSLYIPEKLAPLLQDVELADDALEPLRAKFQKDLEALAGYHRDTLEGNQMIASIIQAIAYDLRVAFICPKCGQHSRLKCSAAGNSKTGAFCFAHTTTTHGGTTSLPALTVAPVSALSTLLEKLDGSE